MPHKSFQNISSKRDDIKPMQTQLGRIIVRIALVKNIVGPIDLNHSLSKRLSVETESGMMAGLRDTNLCDPIAAQNPARLEIANELCIGLARTPPGHCEECKWGETKFLRPPG
jgi:hypothetical protein